MIPKIIHYCWFGGREKPKDVIKYIESWKKMMPDYKIMEWNETNCDLENEIDYVQEAYSVKKYAFVSDYIRIKKLYEHGGIYFDTDYELLEPINDKLQDMTMVLGFQENNDLMTAFIAAIKNHPILKEFKESYHKRHFLQSNGEFDTSAINYHFNHLMVRHGIELNGKYQEANGIRVFPVDVMCAFDVKNWCVTVTDASCAIHHMASSWQPKHTRAKIRLIMLLQDMLGVKMYIKIRHLFRK